MKQLRDPWALSVLLLFTVPCWVIGALLVWWWAHADAVPLAPDPHAHPAGHVLAVPRGGTLHVARGYCAERRVEATASRVLQNSASFHLPGISAVFEAGCHQVVVAVEIPPAVPPGLYAYRFRVSLRTTPITARTVEFPAVLVRVTEPHPPHHAAPHGRP